MLAPPTIKLISVTFAPMSKQEKYENLFTQIRSLTTGESDNIANLGNICAAIQHNFQFWWVGFYLVKNDELVLGPFQGPVACTRIGFGKGVCGKAWELKKTINVPDVHQFEDHIACSSASNSEIVVPILKNNEVIMVLDIDSTEFSKFDAIDENFLHQICEYIATII